ncbi:FAM111A [Branchiostoma lanceolatum]|uniref:Serine protease n=1 Tax=Branchiostoma lanceolatum TaxID=7740 RepID=A0A8J9YXN7_BRALA|nr:FAM111A [Branchiostoma lanceolatum]
MALCYKWDTRSVRLRAPRSKEADFRIPSLLVNEGADPDILKDGSPLLTHALRSKNVLACKALVKAGADLSYAAKDGYTHLHLAAAVWGNRAIVRALVKAGADITAKTKGKLGQTPLEMYRDTILDRDTHSDDIKGIITLLSHSSPAMPAGSMAPTDPTNPRKRSRPARGEASTSPPITEDKRSISERLPSELTRLQQLATQLLGPQFNLVPNSEDDEQERITRIRSLIRAEHFSSKVNYSLDSAADDLIHERKRSVCKVEWPGGSGSGFLIGKNKILTNNHIYEMMKEASKQPDGRSADHRNYRAIFVLSEHQPVVCHMAPKPPLSCGRDLDYAILELAPQEGDNSISDVIPLGQFVSDNLEKDGMVVVVGHPGGGRKKIDFCPISGLDEKYIIHVLFGNPNVPREDIHRATYHTGVMFHGSSGSAGFDRNGNLVLMHTRGFFPIENQTSLIEEGVRLSSIREHARQNLAPEVFNEIFPQRLGGFSFGQ